MYCTSQVSVLTANWTANYVCLIPENYCIRSIVRSIREHCSKLWRGLPRLESFVSCLASKPGTSYVLLGTIVVSRSSKFDTRSFLATSGELRRRSFADQDSVRSVDVGDRTFVHLSHLGNDLVTLAPVPRTRDAVSRLGICPIIRLRKFVKSGARRIECQPRFSLANVVNCIAAVNVLRGTLQTDGAIRFATYDDGSCLTTAPLSLHVHLFVRLLADLCIYPHSARSPACRVGHLVGPSLRPWDCHIW